MTTGSDNFDRGNAANLGANWTRMAGVADDLGISGNAAICNTIGVALCGDFYNAFTFSADQYSNAKCVAVPGSGIWAVGVRCITTGGANREEYSGGDWFLLRGDHKYAICKEVANAFTSLAAVASQTLAAGDIVKQDASGTTLTLYVNGVSVLSATDASLSSGQPGIFALDQSGVGAVIDDWSGGDLNSLTEDVLHRPAMMAILAH